MIKLSSKIISIIVGVATVGTVTATAAVASQNNSARQNLPQASSTVLKASSQFSHSVSSTANSSNGQMNSAIKSSSATITSTKGVANTEDGINEIQKATDDGVSEIHQETQKSINQIRDTASSKSSKKIVQPNINYWVVNPQTGMPTAPGNSNYEKFKAELGGDAGTVPTSKSTACQAALKRIHEKYEADKAASKAPKELKPGESPHH